MKQKVSKKQLLLHEADMDCSVNFMVNGDINVVPCAWERGQQVTRSGERIFYRAGVVMDAEGNTHVRHYNDGSRGTLHETLFETLHGAVKMTRPQHAPDGRRRMDKESVFITFRFPKKYGVTLTRSILEEEFDEVMSFLKTRKEETIWK